MHLEEFSLRTSVSTAWLCWLLIVLTMGVVDLVQSAVIVDFTKFDKDPGQEGLNMLIIVMTIYALMPILVRTIDNVIFRWFVVAAAVFFTMFFIAHEVSHLIIGDMPWGIRHSLDLAHHAIGIWMTIIAGKWAHYPAKNAAQSQREVGQNHEQPELT